MEWSYTFSDFVRENGGAVNVADLLGVTVQCVNLWRRGETIPSTKIARRIIALSQNRITFEGIYAKNNGKNVMVRQATDPRYA